MTRRAASSKRHHESKPRPQDLVEWLTSLALWRIVTVAWFVTVPFALIYVAVGLIIEALFGILLRRSEG